jgi:hypothetical protein
MDKWEIKGPWRIVEHSWEESSVYDAETDTICNIKIDWDVTEETQAHYEQIVADKARAIAALPDLIEAAEDACLALEWAEPEPKPKLQRLRSALLKAKGGEG